MEVITIDAELFEKMLSAFERFAGRMETLCRLHADRDIGKWLDNQDVCLLLCISPGTLRRLRDTGELGFSKISRKVYYRPQEVEKIIPLVGDMRRLALRKGKQI
jgi:hypothetical protein